MEKRSLHFTPPHKKLTKGETLFVQSMLEKESLASSLLFFDSSSSEPQPTPTATSRGAESPATLSLTRWIHSGLGTRQTLTNSTHFSAGLAKGSRVKHSGVCLPGSSQPTAGWQPPLQPYLPQPF